MKQPTVSQSAKPGHLNGQCLREKSSYPDWTADEQRGKQVHERQALEVAHWLQAHPQMKQVLHPALHHPGHALWRRDFTGSNQALTGTALGLRYRIVVGVQHVRRSARNKPDRFEKHLRKTGREGLSSFQKDIYLIFLRSFSF